MGVHPNCDGGNKNASYASTLLRLLIFDRTAQPSPNKYSRRKFFSRYGKPMIKWYPEAVGEPLRRGLSIGCKNLTGVDAGLLCGRVDARPMKR